MTPPLAQRWSALHHGIDAAAVPGLSCWLALMWRLARPLVRGRVPATAVTIFGVVLALVAVGVARPWPWIAAGGVVLAALADGLDGAVAVLSDRATPAGARADAVADRIADAAFAAVLWRCGAPWWLAVIAGALAWVVDGARRLDLGRGRGPGRRDRITVAERPSWAICATLACGSAAITAAAWPVLVCAGVWIALGVLGVVQIGCAAAMR